MNDSDKDIIYMSTIPMLYSTWEGFIVNSFTILTQHINRNIDNWDDLHINLLTHSLDNKLTLSNQVTQFGKKINFINKLMRTINGDMYISPNIPTKSNINYKVVSSIFERFNIPPLDTKYKDPLNKLLLYRNKISHGEQAVPVDKDIVNELSGITINLIYDVFLLLDYSVEKQCYKKSYSISTV